MSLRTGSPLLLDHPVLAGPAPGECTIWPAVPSGKPVRRLSRRERLAVAAQVLALASHLQELELHVGAAPVRNMLVLRDARGVRAVLRARPRPVDGLAARLGGAEMAVRGSRDGLLEALAAVLEVELPVDPADRRIEWLTFEPWLEAVLAELRPPLPAWVARSLWALRLDPLPEPAEGEIVYWSMPRESLAHRLAAALAVAVRSRGGRAHWYRGSLPDGSTAPLPAVGSPGGVLVLSGTIGLKDLLAAERWVEEGTDRSSVVVGRFPGGWAPPVPPVLGGDGLENHLLVTGVPRDRARLEVERWSERLRCPDAPGGEALTRSAAWLFAEDPPGTGMGGGADELLRRCLGLAPEGVPEGFLSAQSGLAGEPLAARIAALGAEREGGRWRWPSPQPVRRDPLHLQMAALFPEDDPRRLLHGYLGDPSRTELLAWARERLRAMEPGEVRSILGLAEPGALSGELLACRVEAALADLDIATARPLVERLPEGVRACYDAWLAAVDGPLSRVEELLPDLDPRMAPVAVGEAALRVLERSVQRGTGDAGHWAELAHRAAEAEGGPAGARLRREAELLLDPRVLEDRAWRKDALRGPERLRKAMLRRVANLWKDEGRPEPACRLLLRVLRREDRPGYRGLSELDLGYIALNRGRNVEADHHHLRAMRLLQAAGFRWRTRVPAFNLGVADLDRLQVERALRRLEEGAEEGWDPFFEAEMARLDLARGRETSFLERLAVLKERVARPDRSLAAPLALLEGVAALLRHDLEVARSMLVEGGEESEGWLAIVGALHGRAVRAGRDGWGLFLAARCLHGVRNGQPEAARRVFRRGGAALQEGFALALCERLLGRQAWADGDLRRRAARTLGDGGLDGWRRVVAPGAPGGAVSALAARILESGTVPGPEHRSWEGVLEELGLDGLEFRGRHGGPALLRVGRGEAGEETLDGSTVLVPLGGGVPSDPAWKLLGVVLSLTLAGPGPEPSVGPCGGTGFVGGSPASQALRAELERLAPSSVPVVLVGETGVGKEVAARALHELSGRRGPFVPVNMAALPPQLVEAELFGSVRGAFTGAERSRRGLVAAAEGGTLFLDEIGEMDMALQAKLLRFLESSEVRPVGSEALHRVDVRVISATNCDLERAMAEGRFRTDLYFRIATAVVRIEPLRERPEDIADLVEHFTAAAVARHGLAPARWSSEALGALSRHSWPGNARELRNVVEMALIAARGGIIGPSHLPLPVREGGGYEHPHGSGERPQSWEEAHRRLRRGLIEDALRRNGGNRSAAARELGITRQTLLYHMKSLGVE